MQVLTWLSEIWQNFDRQLLKASFDLCGITSRDKLHSTLAQMLREKKTFVDYVDYFADSDEFSSFEQEADPTLDDDDENLNGIDLDDDDEFDDEDYEDEESSINCK